MKIRIGTRKSRLAMAQTEIVKAAIEEKFGQEAEIEIVPVVTQGDRILNRSLTSFGGKGVFTKELEEQLLEGTIDLAVHSAKDMPMELPEGLSIGAVLEREDPRDVLVTRTGISAKQLPPGSVIGTSSLRRELQIRAINPQVQIQLLRGNVETRLEKLKQGEYDGILLAAAGLNRLGIREQDGFFFEYMDTETFVPAAGQGILSVEIRTGELKAVMEAIHSEETAQMLEAERLFLAVLGGGCNAPCGAYCEKKEYSLRMNVMYAADGQHPVFEALELAEEVSEEEADWEEELCLEEETGQEEEADWEEGCSLPQELAFRLAQRMLTGKVTLAGAGPGDKGLVSQKALEAVRKADVIVYDNLIAPSILNEARLDAELIYVGKRSGSHSMKQEEINRLLVDLANQGKFVLRLKGGDPYVFGRGGEEAMELAARQIPFTVIPGVSSAYSVPAYAGIPVTDRNLASSFHVITGHEGLHKQESVLDYQVLAKEEGTLVFLMGLHSLKAIAAGLIQHGKDPKTPAAVIEKGTMGGQRTVTAALEDIWEKTKEEGMKTPAVIVVGKTVNLRKSLSWLGSGPLFGKRILITGTRQMAEQLEAVFAPLQAETVAVSLIEAEGIMTEKLAGYFSNLSRYTWIVFTSSNGVVQFFGRLQELEVDHRSLGCVKFAVIGKGTEQTLKRFGFFADFVPSVYSSEAMAREWVAQLGNQDRVLFVKAEESSKVLPNAMDQAGISWDGATVYRIAWDLRRKEDVERVAEEMDYILLTSGSGAKAFAAMAGTKKRKGKLVSIGPVTTKEAEKAGLSIDITAAVYTAEGIGAAVFDDVQKEKEGLVADPLRIRQVQEEKEKEGEH